MSTLKSPTQLRPVRRGFALIPIVISVSLVVLTTLPYLICEMQAHGRYYTWAAANVPDYSVYLTWTGLAASGQLFDPHLFTTNANLGMLIDPVYILIGWLAALLHLPLPIAYHFGRCIAIVGFVYAAWWFVNESLSQNDDGNCNRTRLLAMLLICFSSGIGWALPFHFTVAPIDTWQPEAITFLSLYLFPHFAASMTLITVIFALFLKSEREGKLWPMALAGILGSLLALVHTYDVVTVAIVGIVTVILRTANSEAKAAWVSLLRIVLAGVLSAPGFIYVTWQYTHDPLLASQNMPVYTAPPLIIMAGYGLVGILAIVALAVLAKSWMDRRKSTLPQGHSYFKDDVSRNLIVAWTLGTIIAIYIPFAFQRKLIEGLHIPLCILAAIGFDLAISRIKSLPVQRRFGAPELALVLISSIGLWVFCIGSVRQTEANNIYRNRAYLLAGEIDALDWLKTNAAPGSTVQALLWIGRDSRGLLTPTDATLQFYVPPLTLHHEYVGHWSLTPDFYKREYRIMLATETTGDVPKRMQLLKQTGINYIIFAQKDQSDPVADQLYGGLRGVAPIPSYYKLVYSNPDADVYEVRL